MLFSQFQRSKDQKYYKTWTNENVFVYILGFIFYGVSLPKADSHNKYLTLCLAHFLKQDHLLNLIILGVYSKR